MSADTRIFIKIMLRGMKQIVSLLEKWLRGDLREDQL